MIDVNQAIASMDNHPEFYILGLPINTEIGHCHFLKVRDYPTLNKDLELVRMTKLHFLHAIKSDKKNDEEVIQAIEELSLLEIVVNIFPDVLESYKKVFSHFFKDEEALNKIESEEKFMEYRDLILKLSCIKEEEINPNPEIQAAIERSKRMKDGGTDFATIVTSVAAIGGKSYEQINDMTVYQLYMEFQRLAQKISYDTSILFATVAEKVKIDGWNKEIDMFEEEKYALSRSEFSKIADTVSD